MLSSVRGSSSALLRAAPRCIRASRSTPTVVTQNQVYTHNRSYVTEIWKNKTSDIGTALARSKDLFKTYKPVSPGIRHLKRPLNPHLYEGRPLRSLTVAKRKNGGRNGHGHITVRHRGGGHRQRIRIIDYKREAPGVHDVVRIEYDPNRSAHIALLYNRDPKAIGDKKWSYIIATEGMRAGDEVRSFRQGIPSNFLASHGVSSLTKTEKKAPTQNKTSEEAAAEALDQASDHSLALGLLRSLILKPGYVLPLHLIPPGTVINSITLSPTGPARLVRSAGSFGQVVAYEEGAKYVQVRLQSGEVRKILRDCCATIGKVSNPLWKNRNLGKAGRSRWLGIRPAVRGVAMNANDHPHGGGRGKSKSNKHPVSIWGWGTKGTRTRKPGPKGPKNSNKMVIRERPRGVEKRGTS
ncbi:54S ribosomal protein rml2, mitochondrial [Psilocybe cubensis]|uniref:54S ribosomal protein rml2, mitochondrial n=2 Tax=Psilocybe cubensis TaxID=181762 RepID=A0ACB8HE98_PSICU|nr:54S ribosomal protein rml2, mitochondrial [Psilocybe cubensis]KAH9486159.1 54S ribosomal protein rml2, mitochondrial [Psilocybe cubensis]